MVKPSLPNNSASCNDRRSSEPSRTVAVTPPQPPRPHSVVLPSLLPNRTATDHHPNQEVVLDEVAEGEMVENKLVIPDDMMQYLSQVNIIIYII